MAGDLVPPRPALRLILECCLGDRPFSNTMKGEKLVKPEL